jgi:hypothetical protein
MELNVPYLLPDHYYSKFQQKIKTKTNKQKTKTNKNKTKTNKNKQKQNKNKQTTKKQQINETNQKKT